jgi:hypothetical protein
MEYKALPAHPYAAMFPMRPGKPLDDLAESIKQHGLSSDRAGPGRAPAFYRRALPPFSLQHSTRGRRSPP